MKFERKERRLLSSPEDVVAFALPRYAMKEEAPPARLGLAEETVETFLLDIPLGDVTCAIAGEAAVKDGVCSLLFSTVENPREMSKDALGFVRGVAFLCLYALEGRADSFSVTVENPSMGVTETFTESPKKQDLSRFFEKLRLCLFTDPNGEIERLTRRYPTFLSVPCPYAEAREGQKDMMGAVYTAVKQGETLFATAPTGTGKTMAALFPALRALGAGHAEKLFYLTPKTTSAQAAVDACRLLREKGADLRAVHLLAKERLCEGRRARGTCFGCERFRGGKTKLGEAVRALREGRHSVVAAKELTETARQIGREHV